MDKLTHKERPFNYARKRVLLCRMSDPLTQVAKMFESDDTGSAIVKDSKGEYVGMITDAMIFKAIASGVNVTQLKVGDLKLDPFITVDEDSSIEEVMEAYKKGGISRIAIKDRKDEIIGVLKKTVLDRFFRFELGSRMTRKR
ncbi:CBS domain-containing protein [Candidatus Altiarchaeota archaeon]